MRRRRVRGIRGGGGTRACQGAAEEEGGHDAGRLLASDGGTGRPALAPGPTIGAIGASAGAEAMRPKAASASRSDPHVAPSSPPPAAPEAPATSDGDWSDGVENDAAAVEEDGAPPPAPPEPPAPPVAEAPEQDVDAARLVGELHAAFLARDAAAELAALQELLARPAGPGDAALSEFVWPVLSAARDHDGGAPKALRSSGPAADAYAMARGRWGPSAGTGVGFGYGGGGRRRWRRRWRWR